MRFDLFRAAAHPDKLAAGCNKIAIVLASNAPFYPLYLYFILGRAGLPLILFPAISLPFFAATIPISRRSSLWGRIWINAVSTIDSFYVTWLLGAASGTGLFLIPCITLAILSFRGAEFWPMAVLACLPYGLLLLTGWHLPPPPQIFTPAAYHSLVTLSEISVASITFVICTVMKNARD
jgi:hypothetical protein